MFSVFDLSWLNSEYFQIDEHVGTSQALAFAIGSDRWRQFIVHHAVSSKAQDAQDGLRASYDLMALLTVRRDVLPVNAQPRDKLSGARLTP
jgi:hypothetical protein